MACGSQTTSVRLIQTGFCARPTAGSQGLVVEHHTIRVHRQEATQRGGPEGQPWVTDPQANKPRSHTATPPGYVHCAMPRPLFCCARRTAKGAHDRNVRSEAVGSALANHVGKALARTCTAGQGRRSVRFRTWRACSSRPCQLSRRTARLNNPWSPIALWGVGLRIGHAQVRGGR